MAYGLIKDSTLTALAGSLRDKGIAAETRNVYHDFDQYKSDSAPSFDDPTPTETVTGSFNYRADIPIPLVDDDRTADFKAFKIVVKIAITGSGNNGKQLGAVDIYRTIPENGASITYFEKDIYSEADTGEFEAYTIQSLVYGYRPSNRCYITVYKYPDWEGNIGVSYKVYPIDLDGNTIPCREIIPNTLTPEKMIEAIYDAPPAIPESAFTITGDCNYRFAYGGWDWFVNTYKDRIVTKDIKSLVHGFDSCTLETIPFDINITNGSDFQAAFYGLDATECPRIRGTFKFDSSFSLNGLLHYCSYLRDIEDLFEPSMLDGFVQYKPSNTSTNLRVHSLIQHCRSLRRLPSWLSKLKINPEAAAVSTTYHLYANFCYGCTTLDEALDIPVYTGVAGVTSNILGSSFLSNCNRLKDFTFETDNGQPIAAKWKSQTITINTNIGYGSSATNIYGYNSGVTVDKEVKDDATYQALKNDPDWFTTKVEYSRYNHDSAVNTINSLPDTSAYLASAGGTNTIKLNGKLGAKTDGGAINTLTAEEIAVATAKGWTVSLT